MSLSGDLHFSDAMDTLIQSIRAHIRWRRNGFSVIRLLPVSKFWIAIDGEIELDCFLLLSTTYLSDIQFGIFLLSLDP